MKIYSSTDFHWPILDQHDIKTDVIIHLPEMVIWCVDAWARVWVKWYRTMEDVFILQACVSCNVLTWTLLTATVLSPRPPTTSTGVSKMSCDYWERWRLQSHGLSEPELQSWVLLGMSGTMGTPWLCLVSDHHYLTYQLTKLGYECLYITDWLYSLHLWWGISFCCWPCVYVFTLYIRHIHNSFTE